MRVFISYSGTDLELVEVLAEGLEEIAEVSYWDGSAYLGESDWEQIFEWIDAAHVVVVLITDRTVKRAMAVGQEIGHARSQEKPIIPLIAHDVKATDLGCLQGIAYQRFREEAFGDAVDLVVDAVEERRKAKNTKNLIGAGLLGTFAYVAYKKNKDGKKGPEPPPYL